MTGTGRDLRGKRAVVMGLGLFSGGVESARWLAARGARVVVTDLKGAAELAPSVEALSGGSLRTPLVAKQLNCD